MQEIDKFSANIHYMRIAFNLIWGMVGISYFIFALIVVVLIIGISYTTKMILYLIIGVVFLYLGIYFYRKKPMKLKHKKILYIAEQVFSWIIGVMLLIVAIQSAIKESNSSPSYDFTDFPIKTSYPKIVNGTVSFELHAQTEKAKDSFNAIIPMISLYFSEIYGVEPNFFWGENVKLLTVEEFKKKNPDSVYVWILDALAFKAAIRDKNFQFFINFDEAYGVTPSNDLIVLSPIAKFTIFCHEFGHTLNVGHYYFDNNHLMSANPKLKDKIIIDDELKEKIKDWHRQNNYSPSNNWTLPDFVMV